MGVNGRRRLVAQPGGLTMSSALHLVLLWQCCNNVFHNIEVCNVNQLSFKSSLYGQDK